MWYFVHSTTKTSFVGKNKTLTDTIVLFILLDWFQKPEKSQENEEF